MKGIDGQGEEDAAIAAEVFGKKRGREVVGGVDEKLRLDTVETGGLLERADGVTEQLEFDAVATVTGGIGVFDVEISYDALGSLVDEKAVTVDSSALDGGETGEDAGVSITENHVGRGTVVPMESASPDGNFLLDERAKVR
jgi:hypothetical protein